MAAFTLDSDTRSTVSTPADLYAFLSDFRHFNSILPEDKIEDFRAEADSCSFTIKGITPLSIRIVEKETNRFIRFSSEGLSKFNFRLLAQFHGDAHSPGQCSVQMQGELNPFILKMAEKSLRALINSMSLKLSQLQLPQT
ncbi:MAG TPA: hypothetical protein PLQ93_08560 [Bacteroidia bacterium]|nr:hypothetical protein [Bacteroidia bacterium]